MSNQESAEKGPTSSMDGVCETCLDSGEVCGICGISVDICPEIKHETQPMKCPKCSVSAHSEWGPESVVGQIKASSIKFWLELNPDIESMSVCRSDLNPEVQEALRQSKAKDAEIAKLRGALEEMDALAYAALDGAICETVQDGQWLKARKADYARLHAILASPNGDGK